MQMHDRQAFTFIELMIVLGMLGILSALSWEGYKALIRRYQFHGTARALAADLRSAQQQALITRQSIRIFFDPDQGQYSVWAAGTPSSPDPGDRPLLQVYVPVPVRFGFAPGVRGPPSDPAEIQEPDGITFRDNRLVFLPNGGLGTGAGAVYLTDDPQGWATGVITVTVSGHVRLYQWTGEGWR